jgi:hypothetical protein
MTDPTLLTVAAALAGDVQIGDDAAWSALQDVVAAKPQVAAELAQAREQRGSATSIDSVAQRLQEASAEDADFAGRLSDAWTTAARGPRTRQVHNQVGAPIGGHVFQTGEIVGSLSFGPAPHTAAEPRSPKRNSWLKRRRGA